MGRVSQAQAQENRRRIVATAARLFRERGVAGVSVADVMAEVGLTHGGFYRHFPSKEALVAEAVEKAYTDVAVRLEALGRDAEGRTTFVDRYLSPAHRDSPGDGCPAAGFAGDLSHPTPGDKDQPAPGDEEQQAPGDKERQAGPARAIYAEGVEQYARWLGGDGPEDLAALSTLVGAIMLARATAGTDLSARILESARASLLH